MFCFLNSSKFKFCFLFIFSIFLVPFSVFAYDDEIDLDNHITNTNLDDDNFEFVYHDTELNYTYKENSSLNDFFSEQGISLYADIPDQLPISINFLDFTGDKTHLYTRYIDLPVGDSIFEDVYVIDIYFSKNCWNDEFQIYIAPYLEPDLVNYFEWNSRVPSTINGIAPAQMYAMRVQGFGFNEDSVSYDTADNLFYWGDETVEYYHYRKVFFITQPDTIPTLDFTLISSPLSNFNVYDYSGEDLQHTAKVCGQQQIYCYYEIFNYNAILIRTNLNDQYGLGRIGLFEYAYNENDVLGFSFHPYSNELIKPEVFYQYYMSEFFEENINIYVCPHDINTIVSDHNFTQSQDILDSKIDNFENVVQEYNKIYKPEFKQENFHITYQSEVNNFASNTFEPILKNDLVIKLLICCLTVCLCAYILFGKRS